MSADERREALAKLLVSHQRIPTYTGRLGAHRCSGCDHLEGESDGANSPRHAEHLASLVLAAGYVPPDEVAALRERLAAVEALAVDAINSVGSSHAHWREGGITGACRTCDEATHLRGELRDRLAALRDEQP